MPYNLCQIVIHNNNFGFHLKNKMFDGTRNTFDSNAIQMQVLFKFTVEQLNDRQ